MEDREIIELLKTKSIYSVVVENYYRMSKEQLRDICKELDFYANNMCEHKQEVIESLQDLWKED